MGMLRGLLDALAGNDKRKVAGFQGPTVSSVVQTGSAAGAELSGMASVERFRDSPSLISGTLALASLGTPGGGSRLFGIPGAPATRAAAEAAVRAGKIAGGAVTVKRMSPAAMAAHKAKTGGAASHPNYMNDLIHQHREKSVVMQGADAIKNLIRVAKDPKHGNSSYHPPPAHMVKPNGDIKVGTNAWDRGLDPESMKRLAIVITPRGRIHVGAPGMHHDQVAQAAGITARDGYIQAEVNMAKDVGGGEMTPNLWNSTNGISLGGKPAEMNAHQRAGIVDFLTTANGKQYAPRHGEVMPSTGPTRPDDFVARSHIRLANKGGSNLQTAKTKAILPPGTKTSRLGAHDMGHGATATRAQQEVTWKERADRAAARDKLLAKQRKAAAKREALQPKFDPTRRGGR